MDEMDIKNMWESLSKYCDIIYEWKSKEEVWAIEKNRISSIVISRDPIRTLISWIIDLEEWIDIVVDDSRR